MAMIRLVFLATGYLALTLFTIPFQWTLLRFRLPGWRLYPLFYHRLCCKVIGIRVHVHGELIRGKPLLMATNHTSYLDIPIIGSLARLSFIAKSEVGTWPVFGILANLQRSVYVDRQRRSKTGEHRDIIQRRLATGETLVLFAEGTSGDGNRVLPFKSALMGAAQWGRHEDEEREPILVQPVAVAYTRHHGLPMGRQFRPYFAWYGDMELVPHLLEMFRMGPIDVHIYIHPPVTIDQFGTRKALAEYCHAKVAGAVANAIAGRPVDLSPYDPDAGEAPEVSSGADPARGLEADRPAPSGAVTEAAPA